MSRVQQKSFEFVKMCVYLISFFKQTLDVEILQLAAIYNESKPLSRHLKHQIQV